MRKIVSFVLACVIMLTSSVSVAFADVPEYEGAFGVIINAEGEVI